MSITTQQGNINQQVPQVLESVISIFLYWCAFKKTTIKYHENVCFSFDENVSSFIAFTRQIA